MKRPLNLRQIEAFKAVVESGTVSGAAEVLHVSQPAVSKLIAHLEEDTRLQLFERVRGKLTLTSAGIRLYDQVDRIFIGVRQVEKAVGLIHREEQGELVVGVPPALSGQFIREIVSRFRASNPHVRISVVARSSQFIAGWLLNRQLDVGFLVSRVEHAYMEYEALLELPLVCIMPKDHILKHRTFITPQDMSNVDFIAYNPASHTASLIDAVFREHDVQINSMIDATTSNTVCELVAAGLGISLVHPLLPQGLGSNLEVRPFMPAIPFSYQLCRPREPLNAKMVGTFIETARAVATETVGILSSTGDELTLSR